MIRLRDLPSVERIIAHPRVKALSEGFSHQWVVSLARQRLEEARNSMRTGQQTPALIEIVESVVNQVESLDQTLAQPVINGTGVVLHTNMGRAPLSQEAVKAMVQISHSYSNLELDLDDGKRGSRQAYVQSLLCFLTNAETALVVNNNASAVLLGLASISRNREVIISRGEAVEIGGGFRIPGVMIQSGAILTEVGTTNRTYISDYEAAITENTAALIKVHASNFRISGFTHSPELVELVALGHRYKIPLIHDLGSGCLLNTEGFGLTHEPTPQESIKTGVDLAFFSGDKLLGGPQAGIVVGKKDLIGQLANNPMARALRIDKLNLAALSATLLHYVKDEALDKVPVWRMIALSERELKTVASRWKKVIGVKATVYPSLSTIGGGSLPGETLKTWVVGLKCSDLSRGAEFVARKLRHNRTPVMTRIEDDRVVIDPRTVLPGEEEELLKVVKQVLESEA